MSCLVCHLCSLTRLNNYCKIGRASCRKKKKDYSLKRNIDKVIRNAEDDEYIDNPPLKNVNIKSQSHENIGNRLLLKIFTIKIIDLILSNIVRYEKNILAEDFINKK